MLEQRSDQQFEDVGFDLAVARMLMAQLRRMELGFEAVNIWRHFNPHATCSGVEISEVHFSETPTQRSIEWFGNPELTLTWGTSRRQIGKFSVENGFLSLRSNANFKTKEATFSIAGPDRKRRVDASMTKQRVFVPSEKQTAQYDERLRQHSSNQTDCVTSTEQLDARFLFADLALEACDRLGRIESQVAVALRNQDAPLTDHQMALITDVESRPAAPTPQSESMLTLLEDRSMHETMQLRYAIWSLAGADRDSSLTNRAIDQDRSTQRSTQGFTHLLAMGLLGRNQP